MPAFFLLAWRRLFFHLVQLLLQRLHAQAAFLLPADIVFEAQIPVPRFHGVHELASFFHDHGFVEQHHRIAGGEFVGAAQVFKAVARSLSLSVAMPRSK